MIPNFWSIILVKSNWKAFNKQHSENHLFPNYKEFSAVILFAHEFLRSSRVGSNCVAHQILIGIDFYLWGICTTHSYMIHWTNWHRKTCQQIRNKPGIFERVRFSMRKCVELCVEVEGHILNICCRLNYYYYLYLLQQKMLYNLETDGFKVF